MLLRSPGTGPTRLLRILVTVCLTCGLPRAEAETYELTESSGDQRPFIVQSRVQVSGQFQTPAAEGKISQWMVESSASYRYRERRLPGAGRDAAALRSGRLYSQAQARIVIGETVTTPRLHPQVKLLVAQGREDGVQLFSPELLLRRDDIDLLSTPGDSLSVLGLLPRGAIEVGEKWNADTWALQMLADVDAVLKGEVVCRLASVEQQLATVEFSGTIEGASVGAPTKITLSGSYEYDLDHGHIRKLNLSQSEDRKVGAVSPGMKVEARVTMDRTLAGDSSGLEDAVLAGLPLEPDPGQLLLVYDTPWQVRFLHDRGWHLFHKTDRLAILRLLDQGRLISQCNMTRVESVAPGKHTPESQFQSDIRTSLGERLQRIASAEEVKTRPDDPRFIYRVTALGESNGRKLRWIYYLVTEPDGRQVSFVFAVDENDVQALRERDVALVTSVEFLKQQAPTTVQP